jgi:hypothetical protein
MKFYRVGSHGLGHMLKPMREESVSLATTMNCSSEVILSDCCVHVIAGWSSII